MEGTLSSIGKATEFHSSRPVFIIHGRNGNDLATVEQFLATLSVHVVSLHAQEEEQSVIGQAQELSTPAFVVALLTPEDIDDYLKESKTGRVQNEHTIAFDLAYFVHSVGARNISILHKGGVEKSFASRGVSYVPLEDAAWRSRMVGTMKVAGLRIDAA